MTSRRCRRGGAVVHAQAAATPTANAATPTREREVAAVRGDVTAFTDDEEAFFKAGSTTNAVPREPVDETFEDLDEGYKPLSFWDRVMGKRPPNRGGSPIEAPKRPGGGGTAGRREVAAAVAVAVTVTVTVTGFGVRTPIADSDSDSDSDFGFRISDFGRPNSVIRIA